MPKISQELVKILYLDSGIGLAGGQICLVEILKLLDCSRFKPIVMSPPGSLLRSQCSDLSVDWIALSFESTHLTSRHHSLGGKILDVVCSGYSIFHIAQLVTKLNISIVHANTFKTALVAGLAATISRTPLVFHDHVILTHAVYDRFVWNAATRIIASSQAIASKYPERYRSKVKVIHPGVSSDILLTNLDRGCCSAIGYMGRISREKGIHLLIESMVSIVSQVPTARLLIAGSPFTRQDEIYFEEVQKRAQELSIEKNVEFTGYVTDIGDFLARCCLLVVPSLTEGFGRVIIEAMLFGLPVVAFKVGGPSEIIEDGKTGLLVEPYDTEELAQAIIKLLSDRDVAEHMGQRAQEVAKERFSSKRMVESIMQVYEEIIGLKGVES